MTYIALKGQDINIDELVDELDLIDTLLKIEIVDISDCKNDLLKSEVEKDGITLYRKA